MTFDFTLPGQLARQITDDLMDGSARSYITTVTRIPYVHDLFTLTTHMLMLLFVVIISCCSSGP